MYLKRTLQLDRLLSQKSILLLGPRATGKSSLIREELQSDAFIINLLRSDVYLRLIQYPWELEDMIKSKSDAQKFIVIDEIQKIPLLLNEVHRLIEEEHYTFLLTGSSARKLKQQNVNLLAGRAWSARLFPLTYQEIPQFSLERYLQYGGLPSIYLSSNPQEELIAYVDTYLKEEIQNESLVRKVGAFSKFLSVAGCANGQIINFANMASDTGIPASTIREYYQILQDTLLGQVLPAWTKSVKRKAIATAKFYLFDLGVANQLARRKAIDFSSEVYGILFEHFIFNEILAAVNYTRSHHNLNYWRSTSGFEVDFIIGDKIAVEVKTCKKVQERDLKGLRALMQEQICTRYIIISFDEIARKTEGIEVMHWTTFIKELPNIILF
jgi:predicted AAA+ superfamily ATPase